MTDSFSGGIFRVAFPFTDADKFKRRPALALSEPDRYGDIRWAFVTTKAHPETNSIPLTDDLVETPLPRESHLVPDKIFTIHKDRIDHFYTRVTNDFRAILARRQTLATARSFSTLKHAAQRPGLDAARAPFVAGESVVPYAGRVFTEDEVEAAVSSTLDFWLTLGPEGEAFEKELAALLGVKHCLLVNSGSSANLVAISALTTHKLPDHKRIFPGDEVITVAAGFPTTVAPILQVGAVPVFIDNDPVTGNARVDQLEAAYVAGKTKAVMMAHTLGNPFDIGAVLDFCHKHDLWLIEDNCDALGCTYSMPVKRHNSRPRPFAQDCRGGNESPHPLRISQPTTNNQQPTTLTAPTGAWGDLSTQSFYPPHHLTMGEGGAVSIIRRPGLKTYAESFRDWGRDCWCPSGVDNTCGKRFGWNLGELPPGYDHKYTYSHLGYNLKPLDPQAAIGRQQLKKLPAFIEARKQNWEILRRGLADLNDVFEFNLPTHASAWRSVDRSGHLEPSEQPSTINHQPSTFQWDSSHCHVDPSWFGFMIRVRPTAPFSHTDLGRHLDEKKIGNRMLFGGNLLRQPAFVQLRKDRPDAFRLHGLSATSNQELTTEKLAELFPGADEIMNSAIFLGTYPGLTPAMLEYEIEIIKSFVKSF